jgi:hypothetical protein
MEARFDENLKPHIRSVFHGPKERKRNQFVDHISKCQNWRQWQQRYAIPKHPDLVRMQTDEIKIILINGSSTTIPRDSTIICQQTNPGATGREQLFAYLSRASRTTWRYLNFLAQHRHEFSLYVFVLTWMLGWRYLTQFCSTLCFYLILRLIQDFT